MQGDSARPCKRIWTAAKKLEAIESVKKGASKVSVGHRIGVPESTLRGWCKNEEKIRGMAFREAGPVEEEAARQQNGSSSSLAISTPSQERAPASPLISAIAPIPQLEQENKSGSRESLPPAAEAPCTTVPASPRWTSGDQMSYPAAHQMNLSPNIREDVSTSDQSYSSRLAEELYNWRMQQHSLRMMYWPSYMNWGSNTAENTPGAAVLPGQPDSSSEANKDINIDDNTSGTEQRQEEEASSASEADMPEDLSDNSCSFEEALEHAKIFRRWLERCSEHSVTLLQIKQVKYLVDSLERKQQSGELL